MLDSIAIKGKKKEKAKNSLKVEEVLNSKQFLRVMKTNTQRVHSGQYFFVVKII